MTSSASANKKKCAVFGCLSSEKETMDRTFFKFPVHDEDRCLKWVQATGRSELNVCSLRRGYYICDLHFEPFSQHLNCKLKPDAVPTLLLPNPKDIFSDKEIKTIDVEPQQIHKKVDVFVQTTPNALTKAINCQVDIFSTTDAHMSNVYCSIVSVDGNDKCTKKVKLSSSVRMLIKLRNKIKQNHILENNNIRKLYALHLYLTGPQTYRIIREALELPSEETLRKMDLDIDKNFDTIASQSLKSKFRNLQPSDKYCTVCAGVIPLRPSLYYNISKDKIIGFHEINEQIPVIASHSLAIMAKGLFSDWKQVLGYCFLAENKYYEEIQEWTNLVISKTLNTGLKVVAFVSDQSPVFLNLAKKLGVTEEYPYFYLDQKKIYYVFDVPTLVKSMRNHLMENDFEYQDTCGNRCTARWEDLTTFYNQDCVRDIPLAPKLTNSHISPDDYDKMEFRYAIQVFSKAVASAMHYSMEMDNFENLFGTANFIELINNTFDVLNSSRIIDLNKFKRAFSAEPYQMEILKKFENCISHFTILDKNGIDFINEVEWIRGFKISLKSFINLYQEIKHEGFSHYFTRRLNLEELEKIFDSLREINRSNFPIPIQIDRTFKTLFKAHLFNYSETKCSNDIIKLPMPEDIEYMSSYDVPGQNTNNLHQFTPLIVPDLSIEYRFNLPRNDALLHISEYLYKKYLEMHDCKNKSEHGVDTKPPTFIVNYLKAMNDIYKHFFESRQTIANPVGNEIFRKINKEVMINHCCSLFPSHYLHKLFVRLRIYHSVKYNNRLLPNMPLQVKIPFSLNL